MREVDEHGQRRFVVQQVLNTAWPPNARTIRPAPTGIPVQARLVFETDGPVTLAGRATRWTSRHVFVEISDRRIGSVQGVWLAPQDVRRSQ